jgi:hypothetical protein
MTADAAWTELMAIATRFARGDAELDELYAETMHYFDDHAGPMPVAYRRFLEEVRYVWHALESGKLRADERERLMTSLLAKIDP